MKIYAFIDSQNLNLAVRLAGWILDFKKFRIYLKDKHNVCKAYIFIGYTSKNKGLYKFLKKVGYTVVFKPTLIGENGAIKGNCDAELVLYCVSECMNFDKAIIISGDGDFYCLVKFLKEKGKLLSIGISTPLCLEGFQIIVFILQIKESFLNTKRRGIEIRTNP